MTTSFKHSIAGVLLAFSALFLIGCSSGPLGPEIDFGSNEEESTEQESPEQAEALVVTASFIDDLNEDPVEAFAVTSPRFKENTSEDDFLSFYEGFAVLQNTTDFNFPEFEINGDQAKLTGTMDDQYGDVFDTIFILDRDPSGPWMVAGFEFLLQGADEIIVDERADSDVDSEFNSNTHIPQVAAIVRFLDMNLIDTVGAYESTSETFKSYTSQSDFDAFLEDFPVLALYYRTDFNLEEEFDGEAVVSGTIEDFTDHFYTMNWTLDLVDGEWRISGLDIELI